MLTRAKTTKHLFIMISSLLVALFLSSCVYNVDAWLTTMMLLRPPDQIIYVTGENDDAHVSGAIVRTHQNIINPEGLYSERVLSLFEWRYIHTNANFSKEGVYTINIARKRWFSYRPVYFQYTIQVVPPDIFAAQPETESAFFEREARSTTCENVTAIMISPPDSIVYPVGYEGEIDPAGIVVRAAECWFSKRYEIAELDYAIESDVDFNVPGSYIVRVDYTDPKGKDYWFIFTVAVAERVG